MAGEQGRCPNCGSDQVVRVGKIKQGRKGRGATLPLQELS